MRRGYERSQAVRVEANTEAWHRARLVAYVSATLKEPVPSLWEFLPLPGDPTPEQMAQMKLEQARKMEAEMQAHLDDLFKKGYLVNNVTVQA